MNKIRLPLVDTVVMAIVTKRYAVAQFMAQVRTLFYLFDVMRFKLAIRSAMLAFIAVAPQYICFPFQIFGAAPALILTVTLALGYALTRLPAIDMTTNSHRGALYKFLSANFTGKRYGFVTAFYRTINLASDMRWGSEKGFSTRGTSDFNLLRLSSGRTLTRAVPLFSVLIPVSIVFFRYGFTASFTSK